MDFKKIQTLIIWILPLSFLLVTFKEIHIAQQYAELANLNVNQAISLWADEIATSNNYSGAELGVILRIDRAIYSFLIFAIFVFISIKLKSIVSK